MGLGFGPTRNMRAKVQSTSPSGKCAKKIKVKESVIDIKDNGLLKLKYSKGYIIILSRYSENV